MLVHDISKKETRVINFQGTAPNGLKEEMLQNSLEVSEGRQLFNVFFLFLFLFL